MSSLKHEYVHLPLGEDIHFLAGYYTPMKEERLQHNGREVLYVVGSACVEAGCCGNRSGLYAIVPGYVGSWQSRTNERGLPLSEVEPVVDDAAKREIAAVIKEIEYIWSVDFW